MNEIIFTVELFILLFTVLVFLFNYFYRMSVSKDQLHFGLKFGRKMTWILRANLLLPLLSAGVILLFIIEGVFM
jgi:hypothetical protein